jgi:hypothetical protein
MPGWTVKLSWLTATAAPKRLDSPVPQSPGILLNRVAASAITLRRCQAHRQQAITQLGMPVFSQAPKARV